MQHWFLIGFMGSGKSTLGKKLAQRTNRPFIDIDRYIEAQEQCSIPEIFRLRGEQAFRALETHYLQELIAQPQHAVIATGGGLPCHSANMTRMNHAGLTIYLQLPAKALFQRLKQNPGNRPLLASKNEEELKTFISEKLASRTPYYEQARLIVPGLNITPAHLLETLNKYIQ